MRQSSRPARYHRPSRGFQICHLKENYKPDLHPDSSEIDEWESALEEFANFFPQALLCQNSFRLGTLQELCFGMEQEAGQLLLTFRQGLRTFRRKITQVWRTGELSIGIETRHLTAISRFDIHAEPENTARDHWKVSRRQFQMFVEKAILKNFPKAKILHSTVHSDLEFSLSGRYVRLRFSSGRAIWSCLAVSPQENHVTIEAALSSGLIWREYLTMQCSGNPGTLLFLVPTGRSLILRSRLVFIRGAGKSIQLGEIDTENGAIIFQELSDSGNVDTILTQVHSLRSKIDPAFPADFHRVLEMSPGKIDAIACHHSKSVSFRIHGLEFAQLRLDKDQAIRFGIGRQRRLSKWQDLKELVTEIMEHRRATTADHNHPFYRLQAERWLESLILPDIRKIDPRLDPEYVYPQVPAFLSGDRGMIDILTVTQMGRLAILELKVSEDIDLPVQGLDYWLRVRWHHLRHEFSRKGYFSGRELSPGPPILFFVCPQFCYHNTFPSLLNCFSREIPMVQIGVNEDWRSGVQVVMRREWNMPSL